MISEEFKELRLAKMKARNHLEELAREWFSGETLDWALNKLDKGFEEGKRRDNELYRS